MNSTPNRGDHWVAAIDALNPPQILAEERRLGIIPSIRYCASCGEREGSGYAKHCCTEDNLLEDTEPTTKETLS